MSAGKRKGIALALGAGGAATLALLIAGAVFRRELDQSWSFLELRWGGFEARERALESLARRGDLKAIRRILSDRGRSYQMRLRDANVLLRKMVLDREWTEVRERLASQGVALARRSANNFAFHSFTLEEDLLLAPGVVPHEFRVELAEDRRDSAEVPFARTGRVITTEVQLLAKVGRPHAEVIASGMYPAGTFIDRALRNVRVKSAAGDYPFLREIRLSYHPRLSHRDVSGPWVFDLLVDLDDGLEAPKAGTRFSLWAESHLDPLTSWQNEPVPSAWRPGDDVLGDLQSSSGSTWRRTD